ncbi:MAG TPA: GtrA family protein [Anaerolineales bacterium]|jgi:putative flippase GtrA|nr:GtrA family protein [Anaerolineales bacterium]
MILTDDKERVRFFKFAAVGALGSIVDIGIMNLLTHLFDLKLVYAGSISFICAVFSNFTLNRYWTYPDSRSRPLLHQLGMFFLVNSIGIAIRIPILHYVEPAMTSVFERMTHLSHAAAESLAKNATLLIAIGVVMTWNFFINRYWTYNDIE